MVQQHKQRPLVQQQPTGRKPPDGGPASVSQAPARAGAPIPRQAAAADAGASAAPSAAQQASAGERGSSQSASVSVSFERPSPSPAPPPLVPEPEEILSVETVVGAEQALAEEHSSGCSTPPESIPASGANPNAGPALGLAPLAGISGAKEEGGGASSLDKTVALHPADLLSPNRFSHSLKYSRSARFRS